jgi:antitoxin component of RelBE/YafQ-DinJ toxin-antitoxin module
MTRTPLRSIRVPDKDWLAWNRVAATHGFTMSDVVRMSVSYCLQPRRRKSMTQRWAKTLRDDALQQLKESPHARNTRGTRKARRV